MHILSTMFAIIVGNAGCADAVDNFAGWSKNTENGLYTIRILPQMADIPIAERHAWTVTIRNQQGHAVQPSQLAFYGGMRGHGHGLPSTPKVTRELEPGTYLVEGVLFNMHGDWEIVVGVVGPPGPDKVTFELDIRSEQILSIDDSDWTPQQLAVLMSLSMSNAVARAADSSNRFDGNSRANALGQALFFDAGLSLEGNISCASCHDPRLRFTDGKMRSEGSMEMRRNSPTLLGASRADWFYWDGRRDSLWAQALTPIETPGEMDNNRLAVVRYVMTHDAYAKPFANLVEDLPDLDDLPAFAGPYGSDEVRSAWNSLEVQQRQSINSAFAGVGKIIASYVGTLEPAPSRFDRYVASMVSGEAEKSLLSPNEMRGLMLFLDPEKTQCLRCHNGPYFTNFGFNNIGTGIGEEGQPPDFGRMIGLRAALLDEFNCVGRYGDAEPDDCGHHRFAAQNHADNGAFKVPSLRNVDETGPYMHDGRFGTLIDVLEYYREPPPKEISNHELPPLELSDDELLDLASFLSSLTGESVVPSIDSSGTSK